MRIPTPALSIDYSSEKECIKDRVQVTREFIPVNAKTDSKSLFAWTLVLSAPRVILEDARFSRDFAAIEASQARVECPARCFAHEALAEVFVGAPALELDLDYRWRIHLGMA